MQDIDFEDGVWAVVTTPGNGTVIGCVDAPRKEYIQTYIEGGSVLFINPCFGLSSETVPVQGPQGMGMTLVRQCVPLFNCSGGVLLTTLATGFTAFEDMTTEDKRRHKGLVEQLLVQLSNARAHAAGIVPASAGDMPNVQRRPS